MDTELLDDELILNHKNKNANPIHWVSIIILWIGCGFCAFLGLINNTQMIVSMGLLLIVTIVQYYRLSLGIKLTLALLIMAVMNILSFSPITLTYTKIISGFDITIEIQFLFLIILHYFTNRRVLSPFFSSIWKVEPDSEEFKGLKRGSINGFKNRFKDKSTAQLEAITKNDKLVPEAKQAAIELLKERNTPQ